METHENAEVLFKIGVRGRGRGESFFFSITSYFVQYRICLSRKPNASVSKWGKKLESYQRFAKISNQQTFSFYTSIYTWTLAAENDSLAWKKNRENINALQSSVSPLWHCAITLPTSGICESIILKVMCKFLQHTEEFYWAFKQLKCSKLHLWLPPPPPPKKKKLKNSNNNNNNNEPNCAFNTHRKLSHLFCFRLFFF